MTTTFIGVCADHQRTENHDEDLMSTLTSTYPARLGGIERIQNAIAALAQVPRQRVSPQSARVEFQKVKGQVRADAAISTLMVRVTR